MREIFLQGQILNTTGDAKLSLNSTHNFVVYLLKLCMWAFLPNHSFFSCGTHFCNYYQSRLMLYKAQNGQLDLGMLLVCSMTCMWVTISILQCYTTGWVQAFHRSQFFLFGHGNFNVLSKSKVA
jgi:hypothetical protein